MLRLISEILNAFRTPTRLVITICLAMMLVGCERRLRIRLDGNNPPTFRFDGTGELSWVYIYQVTPDGKVPTKGSEFWIIVPKASMKTMAVPPITYGVIPNGFDQKVPSNGIPIALQEGKI
jgi:hypothetical protein